MQDSLNGHNIQCFFIPTGINDKTLEVEYKKTKRKMGVDKKIPYRSLAYNYSENFIVFDYENSRKSVMQAWVHIVEDGKCRYFVPSDVMHEKYPILLVINKYGVPLRISKPSDFVALLQDYRDLQERIRLIKNDGNPFVEKRILVQKTIFELKWFDFEMLPQVNSNIVGIALTILATNKDYDIKPRLMRYCEKHDIDISKAICDYIEWAKLSGIELLEKDITAVLCQDSETCNQAE